MSNLKKEKLTASSELETYFNDQNKHYRTGQVERNSTSAFEEIQVRLNNILQGRKQISENLSGSQIACILDFFVEAAFLGIVTEQGITDSNKICKLKESFSKTLDTLIRNRRKLLSTRFSNEEIYDTLVGLPFEASTETFVKNFLSLRLSRNVYLDFLQTYFSAPEMKDAVSKNYFEFYKENYLSFKNLLLGNYLRFIMAETNRSINQYRDILAPEMKEDYFCGLVLKVLEVIDKYDSYKGTLTSYIENWFKDYKTVFKKNHIDSIFRESTLNPGNESYVLKQGTDNDAPEEAYYDSETETFNIKDAFFDNLLKVVEKEPTDISRILQRYSRHFPEIIGLLELNS